MPSHEPRAATPSATHTLTFTVRIPWCDCHNAVPSSQKAIFEDEKAFTTGLSSGKCLFEDKSSPIAVPSSQRIFLCLKSHFVRRKAVIPDEIHLQKKHSSSYVTEEEGNMFRKDYS